MFINCPNCAALVATDLATDLPPERCPRCGFALREPATAATPPQPPPPPTPAAPAPPPPAPAAAAPPPADPAAPAPLPPAPLIPPARSAAAAAPPAAATVPGPFVPLKPPSPPAPAPGSPAATPPAPAAATLADTPLAEPPAAADTGESRTPARTPAAGEPGRAPDRPDAQEPAAGARRPAAHGRPAPSFAQRRRHAGQAVRHRWPALAASVALASLLALQLLLADRERLAADPQWRPLLARVCGTLGCTLPPWREPQAIALLHRDVRPHPQRPGVLRVSATIRNDARWTQDWPQLQLRLTDIDGRPLGERRFLAHEYLAAAPAPGGMSSGQRATIRMDVLEPSPHTVAFDFEFH